MKWSRQQTYAQRLPDSTGLRARERQKVVAHVY